MLKFRTMSSTPRPGWPPCRPTTSAPARCSSWPVTPGSPGSAHVLRRTSLDELPQLLNVLKGDMSLVGPRPALRREVDEFPAELHARHHVRPGITGLWQVEARDNPAFDAYQRLDLHYVENWSLALDLVILLATAEQLLMRPFASKQPRRDGTGRRRPRRPAFADGRLSRCRSVMPPRPASARRPAATWRGRRRRSRGRRPARTMASSCQLAATACEVRQHAFGEGGQVRRADGCGLSFASVAARARRADRPGTAAARPSPTHHRRPAARVSGRPLARTIASTASRVWNAIDSTTARARWARVVPRVIPTIVPRAYGSHHGEPSPVNAGTTYDAAAVVDLAASGPISAASAMMPSPSRSHWIAEPVEKIAPSRA